MSSDQNSSTTDASLISGSAPAFDPVRANSRDDRGSALCMFIGTAIMLAAMSVHPTAHTHDLATFFRETADGALLNRGVHGSAVAGMWISFCGQCGLALALGLRRPVVRLGLIFVMTGTIVLTGAATANGVILPGLAERYVEANAATQESARPLLVLVTAANRACDHIGIVALGLGLAAWSVVLLRSSATRPLAIAGFICGIGPIIALFIGKLPMTVHGFGLFALIQGLWIVAAAIALRNGVVRRVGAVLS